MHACCVFIGTATTMSEFEREAGTPKRVCPHPVTFESLPSGSAAFNRGRLTARTVAPNCNGRAKCKTAISFLVFCDSYCACRMKRVTARICAFASPRRNVEPAIMEYAVCSLLGIKQWAAVKILFVVSTEPPHICVFRSLRLIWYGCARIVVALPPIILSSFSSISST